MNCTVHHTRLVPEGARLERQVHLRHRWAQKKSACGFHQNRLHTIRQRHPGGVVVQAMSAGTRAIYCLECMTLSGFLMRLFEHRCRNY